MTIQWQSSSTQLLAVLTSTTPGLTTPISLITAKPNIPTATELKQTQLDSGPNIYGYMNGDVSERSKIAGICKLTYLPQSQNLRLDVMMGTDGLATRQAKEEVAITKENAPIHLLPV